MRLVHTRVVEINMVSFRYRDFVAESLKMWFQVVGFALSGTVGTVFFSAPPSISSTRTYQYFSKILSRWNVFF